MNKANATHDMIKNTGVFNVSILSTDVPFTVFKHFGFQSGRNVDKFVGYEAAQRAANGLYYITEAVNGMISAKVVEMKDYGTHTLFVAEVTEARILSDVPSVTYQYYFDHSAATYMRARSFRQILSARCVSTARKTLKNCSKAIQKMKR